MFDAVAQIAFAIALILPGFLVVQLSERRRPSTPAGGDLSSAEAAGSLQWWHYALGGRDARRAWDYTFSRHNGTWIRVHFKDPAEGQAAAMLGQYGTRSWASQSPAHPDLYLQAVWPVDADGRVAENDLDAGPVEGMWIDGDQIARIDVLHGGYENDPE